MSSQADLHPYDRGDKPRCERALVGCLLIDCGLRIYAKDVGQDDFADRALGRVFALVMEHPGPIDLVIADQVGREKGLHKAAGAAGWATYLGALVDEIPSVDHVAEYAKRVRMAAVARRAEAQLEQLRMARATRLGA